MAVRRVETAWEAESRRKKSGHKGDRDMKGEAGDSTGREVGTGMAGGTDTWQAASHMCRPTMPRGTGAGVCSERQ